MTASCASLFARSVHADGEFDSADARQRREARIVIKMRTLVSASRGGGVEGGGGGDLGRVTAGIIISFKTRTMLRARPRGDRENCLEVDPLIK